MTRVLDGRAVAARRRAILRERVGALGRSPQLVLVAITDDGAAGAYFRAVTRAAEEVGVLARVDRLAADWRTVAGHLHGVEADGIVLESPLPPSLREADLATLIPPEKDVDGAGRCAHHRPATALAVMALLEEAAVPLVGAEAVVIGRSAVVGRPVGSLLTDAHATVTVCHTRTRDLPSHSRRADVLVAAAGVPGMVTATHVKPGAVVIDVGTTWRDGGVVGDVDASVYEVAGAYSPVPGGVGPLTATMVVANVVASAS